jgi:hypothetical protein
MTTDPPRVHISKIDTEHLFVPIVGTSPLIVSRFSEKAKRQMLDAQQGRKSPKERRDPEADYQAAFYRTKDGYGFPGGRVQSLHCQRGPVLRRGRPDD